MTDEVQSGDLLPADVIEQLKTQHGEIVVVPTVCGPCAFRPLKRQEYDRFQSMTRGKDSHKAGEYAAGAALVYPEAATFQGYLNRKPGILVKCADEVLILSGVEIDAEAKKYGT